ncbi:hypothetical protein D9M71_527110 [compost metagenome]
MAGAFQVHHGAAGGGGQRVGEGLGLQAELVDVVIERGGGHREAHAAQLGDDPLGALEGFGAQATAHFRRLVDHWLEAQLHQLVGGDQAGDAGADDGDFRTVRRGGNAAETCRVGDPVVEGEGEVRAEDGDGFLAVAVGVAVVIHWNLPAGWRAGPGIQHRPGRKALHGRVDSSPAGPMDGQSGARAKKWRAVKRSPLSRTIPDGIVEMNP